MHPFQKLLTALCAFSACLYAQAYDISGKLVDEESEPMIQATVKLLRGRDSTVFRTAVASDAGTFTFSGINSGKYILEGSYVGYSPVYRNITVSNADINAGTLKMEPASVMLAEARVTGVRTQIKVMQDTIEFNAESYKTAPNAVVEDLLKRLPGVEVSSDGTITSNGKQVTKILVDGKEFFSDDPTVASRNLPVNMVDKLQVVDRKSDLARITGVDDGEEETVINLTVKKGMKNGWFGNAEAGYGTDSRYKAGIVLNRFWNDNQFTIIGGANNVNDLQFTDGGAGRFRRFGGANGVTSAQALGINFNVGNKEIFRVGGDVMWSRSDRDTRTTSETQYLLSENSRYEKGAKVSRDRGNNLRADFRIQWNPDSFNTLEVRPRMSLNFNRSNSLDSTLTLSTPDNNPLSRITRSFNTDRSKGTSVEFGTELIYNHKFRSRPGRSFSIHARYNFSNVRERSDSYSFNRFYLLADSVDLYDQYVDNHTWSNNVSARATWTEPLGDVRKGNFLTLAYNFSYRWNDADRLTYDHPVSFPDGWDGEPLIGSDLVLNTVQSNRFRNNFMNQDIRLGYKRVTARTNLEAGVSLVPQQSSSLNLMDDARSIPTRKVLNVAPFLRYRFKITKTRSLNADYRGRTSQPSMTQLQPVADMTDPLRVVIGNPSLKPTFTHNMSLRFQDFNTAAQRSLMLMIHAQAAQNSIVSNTTFDPETGGRVTTYENVNGVWNIRAMNMLSLPLRNRAFSFSSHTMLFYSNAVGFNNGQRNTSRSLTLDLMPGLTWRPGNGNAELSLRPRYNLQYVNNSLAAATNSTVHSYGGSFDGTYYTPIGLVLATDLNYSATSGYATGYDTRQWMWNASLSYMFLRDKSLTLTVKAYDLLHQQSNVRRNVTANYITDTRYNSLGQYFMATIAYKFNTFGKGNEPQSHNRRFGPGGPGGPPPGAPAGPPPGIRP